MTITTRTRKPVPAVLSFSLPFCVYDVQSASVRHSKKIRFMVEDVENDEDMKIMVMEFVEDLAKAGFKREDHLDYYLGTTEHERPALIR